MSTSLPERFFGAVGAPLVAASRGVSGLASTTGQTLVAIARFDVRRAAVVGQCYAIGNQSLLFIAATLGCLGFISVYQVATQINEILPGEFTMLGAAFIQMMVREFAPTICGLMVATRVGSGIAAEIGSMVVTEQVDALRMCNADPVTYLVAPRTIACGLMMVVLSVFGVIVATAAGMLLGKAAFGIPYDTFLNLSLVRLADVALGCIKAVSYGIAIPIIAGHAGLMATGGSAGVGWATTRAVVNTSFAVVVLDLIISALAFGVFGL